MPELEQRFAAALAALKPAKDLVVGVSGGIDSMALLELLRATGKNLIVAHFNHQLRSRESDEDETFVRNYATGHHLEFVAGRGDVRASAKGISIEMAARKLRHAFLAQIAKRPPGDIVLAHHADDQLELVLMRASRGVEGYGASGMREVSVSPADPNIRILRPLLHFRKSELQKFVEARNVPFREDSSNVQLDIERNRIRHKVIPGLREHFGADVEDFLLQHMETLRAQDDSWRDAAKAWLKGNFGALPDRLQKEIIIVQLERLGISASGKVLDPILGAHGKPISIEPGLRVAIDTEGKIRIFEDAPDTQSLWIDVHLDDRLAEFDGGKLQWRINDVDNTDLSPESGMMVFDAKAIGQHIVLRYPKEGDRVRLSGRGSKRALFDVLARNKIPAEKRIRVVVAATKDDEIFWVEGLRITEDFKVTETTDFVVEWRWTRALR